MHPDLLAVRDALTREGPRFATLDVRGEQALVVPVLDQDRFYATLTGRLAEHWSLGWRVDSVTPPVVRCRLDLLGHAREGLGTAQDLTGARLVALTDAARAWGILPEAYAVTPSLVEYDPDEGPNTAELEADAPEPAPTARALPPEPPRDPQLEKARGHIDDLMDQLREKGLGKQASLVLVRHGGYGNTLDESRKVYAELKALMRS
ncbi:hypothetical protein [Deinococcus pimensis]|uniref:hypothetical protein n=1 Tax=Deinococcus pimensis TaxID=309888 RepID=UPI0004B74670|nr:hypothetical protein [Deinococcus pimensis]